MLDSGALMATTPSTARTQSAPHLRRVLTLWDLILYGIIVIQPVAPMGIYGVISNKAGGHVVTTILIAMVAMLFTAISYGRMARAYPSAGSAYTYVGREIHPAAGYVTGWSMVMDYILNPLICVAFCSKAAMNIIPEVPFYAWVVFFAAFFTFLNVWGIETSATINQWMAAGMGIVVLIFFAAVARYVWGIHNYGPRFFTEPFYNPQTFSLHRLFQGTSVAVLTYIGFDGISTLSEEVENPRRNIMLATVLVCVITGIVSGMEVYAAQLVWGSKPFPSEMVESAFAIISRAAGGVVLFHIINFTLLIANIGSGMGAQLGAARLLYGMGRGNALPKSFFGKIEPKHRIPRNNVIAVGVFALIGAALLEMFSKQLGGGAYEIGAQALNFGAFIAFMGVNAAAFVRYYLRAPEKKLGNLLPPVLGFLICGYIWLNLSRPAQVVGAVWVLAGVAYGVVKTKGFRGELVNFDIPADE